MLKECDVNEIYQTMTRQESNREREKPILKKDFDLSWTSISTSFSLVVFLPQQNNDCHFRAVQQRERCEINQLR